MSHIAVIGSGISGLAAAYFLSRKHQVSLFEKEPRIGGHTHTVIVQSAQGPLALDTGFIVHNESTYSNFCRLLRELRVETQPSDMSFGVTSPGAAIEYSSRGLPGFFAQRRNLFSPEHYLLFYEILRFNHRAANWLQNAEACEAQSDRNATEVYEPFELTMEQFLQQGRYSQPFVERYLYPMASAVWSTPQDEIGRFPALTMLRFMRNHGMLGINTHPKWKTIRGGSHRYVKPLIQPFAGRVVLGAEIASVERVSGGVRLLFRERPAKTFDQVVFACHGNQILPLLQSANDAERDVLGTFRTTRNEVCLHTDQRMLPKRRAARAAWNYQLGDNGTVKITYHMNRLQSLVASQDYYVTLNSGGAIAPEHVIQKLTYCHPVFDGPTVRAQGRWSEISGRDRIHYCGAWWFYGFHEDGLRSALRVAAALGVDW